ncbi:hypothetical protein J6590_082846 [Homalodisca vitripennis]|nr:hypothetical protein J6590_082846 [Homalodisca vitripennis]
MGYYCMLYLNTHGGIANISVAVTETAHRRGWIFYSPQVFSSSRCLALTIQSLQSPQRNCETYAEAYRLRSYTVRQTLPLQSSPVHIETARIHPDLSFQKLYGPQNTASTINHCLHRNCETTPRPLIPEAMRTAKDCLYNQPHSGLSFQKLYGPQKTASTINHCPHRNYETTLRPLVKEAIRTTKHCPYNHPLSTSKLREYTQTSRSRSYTDRKTLPLQSTTVYIETARLHPGLSSQKLCGPQKTASTINHTQASHSRSYTDRQTLPLQSSPVHIETARIHPDLSFQKLYGPQNTASTINHCLHRNCETTPRPLIPEAMRTAKDCLYNQPHSGLSFQKLYGPQKTASTINHCPHRNYETTLRPLVKEAIRTTKLCLYRASASSPVRMRTLFNSQVACSWSNTLQKPLAYKIKGGKKYQNRKPISEKNN